MPNPTEPDFGLPSSVRPTEGGLAQGGQYGRLRFAVRISSGPEGLEGS